MATTANNPKRYPFPRSLTRSIRRHQGGGASACRIPLEAKPEPKLTEKVEIVKPVAATIREKARAAFRALARVFKGAKGR